MGEKGGGTFFTSNTRNYATEILSKLFFFCSPFSDMRK